MIFLMPSMSGVAISALGGANGDGTVHHIFFWAGTGKNGRKKGIRNPGTKNMFCWQKFFF